jgi:hypothetical protein
MAKKKSGQRSIRWFGRQDLHGFLYRSRVVLQEHEGADFDFLAGGSGAFVPRDSH